MNISHVNGMAPRFKGQFLFSKEMGVTDEAVIERTGLKPEGNTPENSIEISDEFIYVKHEDPSQDIQTAKAVKNLPFLFDPGTDKDELVSSANDNPFKTQEEMLTNVFKGNPGRWEPKKWEEQNPKPRIIPD